MLKKLIVQVEEMRQLLDQQGITISQHTQMLDELRKP
jgi:hypothetical protein